MKKNKWHKLAPQLHIMPRDDDGIELSDVIENYPQQEHKIEILASEIPLLIEALEKVASKEDAQRALYIDPQGGFYYYAILENGNIIDSGCFKSAKEGRQMQLDKGIDEVRIDDGFCTPEIRGICSIYGWKADRSFDLRAYMRGETRSFIGSKGAIAEPWLELKPVTAPEYKPNHRGFPEAEKPTLGAHVVTPTNHDFLSVMPKKAVNKARRGESIFE